MSDRVVQIGASLSKPTTGKLIAPNVVINIREDYMLRMAADVAKELRAIAADDPIFENAMRLGTSVFRLKNACLRLYHENVELKCKLRDLETRLLIEYEGEDWK